MKKLLVTTENLLTALQIAKKGANGKNSVLPILECFLCEVTTGPANNARLRITSTDLENNLQVSLPCVASESFAFTLEANETKFIQKLESETVTLESVIKQIPERAGSKTLIDCYSVEIEAGEDKAVLQTENPLDFPKIPVFDYGKQLAAWAGAEFLTDLKTALNYVSTDDLRPAMTGVFFQTFEDSVKLTGTDAHLLRHTHCKAETLYNGKLSEKNKIQAILPAKFCKLLTSFKTDEVLMCIQDSNFFARLTVDSLFEVTLCSRIIDANYPDYSAVIPTNNGISLQGQISPLLKLIGKAQLFANKTTFQGIFSINGDIKLSAEDIDFNKQYTGAMPHTAHTGEDITIAFNLKFMEKALKDIKGTAFNMELSTPTRAAILREENSLTLLMPVMINA